MNYFIIMAVALTAVTTAYAQSEEGVVQPPPEEKSEMEKKEEFPQMHWEEMRSRMESDGPDAVVAFIQDFSDPEERLKLYSFAQQSFGYKEWKGKNFDDYISVVNAGIAEALKQSEEAEDAKTSAKHKDFANVLSYNLSADLAECWPGDTAVREKRHFEVGLAAAEDCIRWRQELSKGPFPFSIAHWAKGMHQMSLGDTAGALESFQKALDYSVEYAREQNVPETITPEGDFVVILNSGYLGIAQWLEGSKAGKARYEEACSAFQGQIDNYEDKKDDAQFGLEQLQYVKDKFIK